MGWSNTWGDCPEFDDCDFNFYFGLGYTMSNLTRAMIDEGARVYASEQGTIPELRDKIAFQAGAEFVLNKIAPMMQSRVEDAYFEGVSLTVERMPRPEISKPKLPIVQLSIVGLLISITTAFLIVLVVNH